MRRLRFMRNGRQVEETFRGTKTAATKRLRNAKSDSALLDAIAVEKAAEAPETGRTFGELLDAWTAMLQTEAGPRNRSKTHGDVSIGLEGIREKLGAVPVDDLTAEHIDRSMGEWLAAGLSPSSAVTYARTISAALAQGVKWRWFSISPMASVTLRSEPWNLWAFQAPRDLRTISRERNPRLM